MVNQGQFVQRDHQAGPICRGRLQFRHLRDQKLARSIELALVSRFVRRPEGLLPNVHIQSGLRRRKVVHEKVAASAIEIKAADLRIVHTMRFSCQCGQVFTGAYQVFNSAKSMDYKESKCSLPRAGWNTIRHWSATDGV